MHDNTLIVTIDIGTAFTENVSIKKGENLRNIASNICQKHNLHPNVQPSIENYLQDSVSTLTTVEEAPLKNYNSNIGDRLYALGLHRIVEREKLAREMLMIKEKAELKDATFKPDINKYPVRVKPTISSNSEIFSERETEETSNANLHRVRVPNKTKNAATNKFKECTFSPVINKKSRALAARRDSSVGRIKHDVNNECTFVPRTGRSPYVKRPTDVFSHLYNQRSNSKARLVEAPSKFSPCAASSKIISKIRNNRFEEIFEMFCPRNGEISKESVEHSHVDARILEILKPILDEFPETIKKSEFLEALDALVKVLTPEERFEVMFPSKQPAQAIKQEEVVPVVKAQVQTAPDVYSRLVRFKKQTEHKLAIKRQEKEIKELEECSFNPLIAKTHF